MPMRQDEQGTEPQPRELQDNGPDQKLERKALCPESRATSNQGAFETWEDMKQAVDQQVEVPVKRGRGRPVASGTSVSLRPTCPRCHRSYTKAYIKQHILRQHFGKDTIPTVQWEKSGKRKAIILDNSSDDAECMTDDDMGLQRQPAEQRKGTITISVNNLDVTLPRQEDSKEQVSLLE
ncbi:hypothetical protein M409DRAFT_20434 [Zasmidium cellare ATCC 36951]|uniref:C2H2-type domain-containing protein n=1 Tax=Zasmidium cellare ATCC 36951 TaxID=1080233 RepID=A0A6A6CQ61_ZASCE|nr:uncharacterized protein M409DRAFT_20434 [Zasmidium cellare ATCC 36951]KAF2169211.1 hypothetical protein M409DRAFT_20434 [Zasmidium cellare ATCC 36951]